jgi:predicted Zn-ribbon and HTH transcriptional regulator
MAKAPKTERAEVFRDHRSQLVLSKFLSGELDKLDPVYDPAYGYRYPALEAIIGDPAGTEEFLTHLYDVGILKRQTYDKLIYCPTCNSANVSIHYSCPYCKSFNIKKSALIEHIPCGYIDTEDRFKKDDKLFCPRCKTELNKPDINYRRAGIWCACNECNKSFDIPVPSHFCRVCSKNFTFDDASYRDVYSYTLNKEILKEAGVGFILVAPIREFLQSRGFSVESPSFLKGKSGASHMFDIAATRGDIARNVVVIDLATTAEEFVSEQSIIAMFAKVYDVAPDKACLIAIPKMGENGKKLAELYNIQLIEAKDQSDAIKALEKCVLAVIQSKIQQP